MSPAVGTRLGPYEIVAAIGAGGMGEVYCARDAKLNRDDAIEIRIVVNWSTELKQLMAGTR